MRTELNILMLEDDIHDAELITDELRKEGFAFRVRRVETGQAMIDLLGQEAPDLILADHDLPGFNGLEALAVVRQQCPEAPLVLVTGLTGTEPVLDMFKQEPVHYVLKSQLSRLVPVIQQALLGAGRHPPLPNHEARMSPDGEPFRTLVEGITDYTICRLDAHGRVSSWNAGAEDIQGYGPEEILGKNFSRFYPGIAVEEGQPTRALARATVQGRFREETVWMRKGGMPFWADVVITRLPAAPAKLLGFSLVVSDISARKEADTERDRLLQELRTTLNNVKILSGLLPICTSCKKIRDYEGRWHPLEIFLRNHSEVTLSHEFCHECAAYIQPAASKA